jgi:hypothetical protein
VAFRETRRGCRGEGSERQTTTGDGAQLCVAGAGIEAGWGVGLDVHLDAGDRGQQWRDDGSGCDARGGPADTSRIPGRPDVTQHLEQVAPVQTDL